MYRAHKTRLNPTPEHAVYLRKACGTNALRLQLGTGTLARSQSARRKKLWGDDACPGIQRHQTRPLPLGAGRYEGRREDGFCRLQAALHNYYASKKGTRQRQTGWLSKFKSKKNRQSCTLDYGCFRVDGHWLRIAKLDTAINMAESLRFDGKLKWATISHAGGRWYVSLLVDMRQIDSKQPAQAAVGVDLRAKTLATLSDGTELRTKDSCTLSLPV